MTSADDAASRLDALASDPAYEHFQLDLKRLAYDLRARTFAAWSKVDLVAFFDAGTVVGEERGVLCRLARHVDLVRNVLLFAPLLITWLGIYFAVSAYRELLAAPADKQAEFADASFLQMWTKGFGERTSMTLDTIALLDFSAIALVIAVFVVGASIQRRAAARVEKDRLAKVGALRSTLVEAGSALSEEGRELVDQVSASARSLLPVYQQTVDRLVTAQREMNALVRTGGDNVELFARATGELVATINTVSSTAKSVEGSTGELAATVRGMESSSQGLADNLGDVTAGMTSAKDGLADVVRKVEGLSRELRDVYMSRIEELRKESSVHSLAVDGLRQSRLQLSKSIEKGQEDMAAWARGAAALTTSGSSIVDTTNQLKDNVAGLTAAAERFDSAVGSLASGTESLSSRLPEAQRGVLEVLTAVGDLGKKMDDIYQRQEVVAQELGVLADNPLAAAVAAKRTAETADQTARTARDAQIALQQTVQSLPDQMDTLRGAVLEAFDRELQDRRTTSDSFSASVVKFNNTAETASASLRIAVEGLRSTPPLLLPELREASAELREALAELAGVLHHSRVLVSELAQASGQQPVKRHWWSRGSRNGK